MFAKSKDRDKLNTSTGKNRVNIFGPSRDIQQSELMSEMGSMHSKFSKLSKFSMGRRRIVTVDKEIAEVAQKQIDDQI